MYYGVPPVPDWVFVRDLREFDPQLRIRFERRFEKFVISKKRAFGDDFNVLVVQTDNGAFRQPDQRDIKKLYDGDLWRHGGVKERVRRGEEQMLEAEPKGIANAEDELKARTRENKIQLSNAYRKTFNEGSKAPELRRIDVQNPRARTIEQIKSARAAGKDPWA
jgi:hypothetical protein